MVTTRVAAKQVQLSHDYIARLAREGKVVARQQGRIWYVDLVSLFRWVETSRLEKECKAALLKQERSAEKLYKQLSQQIAVSHWTQRLQKSAALQSLGYVCVALVMVGAGVGSAGVSSVALLDIVPTQHVATLDASRDTTLAKTEADQSLFVLGPAEEEQMQTEYVYSWFGEPVSVVWNSQSFSEGVLVGEADDNVYTTPFVLHERTRPVRE